MSLILGNIQSLEVEQRYSYAPHQTVFLKTSRQVFSTSFFRKTGTGKSLNPSHEQT